MAHVLFVCLHNAGRSQISQALFELQVTGRHETRSAGTAPADHVHPNVLAVLREQGVGLSGRRPQLLTNELGQWADVVVTMGCGDSCPVIPGKRYIEWDLRDPKDLPLDDVRAIRDDIARHVRDLVTSLEESSK